MNLLLTNIPKDRLWLFIALTIFNLCAIFNNGYYHPDEHYQIVEFAEYKTGRNAANDLAWEYQAKIRPSIQCAIFFLMVNIFRFFHIVDPYDIMTIVRMLTATFSVLVIFNFINVTKSLLNQKLRGLYILLSYFLWFLPFLGARFSSENISGLFFLLALGKTLKAKSDYNYFIIGLLLGFSFLFRFQTALLSIGLLLWLCLIKKSNFSKISMLILATLLTVNIGAIIDYWFYDSFSYSFINYFIVNILQDKASSFGTSPWYYYLIEVSRFGVLPISIMIFAAFFVVMAYDRRNFMVWIMLPFILIHSLIPHKELRFLFPLANLIPFLILSAMGILKEQINLSSVGLTTFRLFGILYFIVNTAALLIVMISPADDEGRVTITEFIHNKYMGKRVSLWYINSANPYKPIAPPQKFYKDGNVYPSRFDITNKRLLYKENHINLMVIQTRDKLSNPDFFSANPTKLIMYGIPKWVQSFRTFFHYGEPNKAYELLEIVRP